jgi:methyl-accepting chemotaxis protein
MESTAAQATLPAGFDPRGRPWYKKAMAEGKASFTEPYRDATSGEMIITSLPHWLLLGVKAMVVWQVQI